MKIKVASSWFNKLNDREKEYVLRYVQAKGIQYVRSFLTAAKKSFRGNYHFTRVDFVEWDGSTYYFSYDRKDFNLLNK